MNKKSVNLRDKGKIKKWQHSANLTLCLPNMGMEGISKSKEIAIEIRGAYTVTLWESVSKEMVF